MFRIVAFVITATLVADFGIDCTNLNRGLRSSKEVLPCEHGWHPGGRRCYYFSRMTTDFFTAFSFCRGYHSYLVEIDDLEEFNTLKRMTRNRNISDYWLGLVDYFEEGVWVKATSLNSQLFTMWNKGEPYNVGGEEHCAASYMNAWYDVSCKQQRYFICEK